MMAWEGLALLVARDAEMIETNSDSPPLQAYEFVLRG
jgi:hypothetical protein